MRMFLADGGRTGFALKGDDIVSVFNHDRSVRRAADAMLELAIAEGGKRLDAFDTVLPVIYGSHGFRAVARVKWDDSQSPSGWNKSRYADFNHGEPDVVLMAYDPEHFSGYSPTDGPVMAYDDAVHAQEAAVSRPSSIATEGPSLSRKLDEQIG